MKDFYTMKRIRYIWLLMVLLMTSSCGELFEFEELEGNSLSGVQLSYDAVDIMVGDSVFFQAEVQPAGAGVSYTWSLKGDTSLYDWEGYWLHAVRQGHVDVYVEAANVDSLGISEAVVKDTCAVNIFEWVDYEYPDDFLYETVVYASLQVNGEEVKDSLGSIQVVAIADDRVRCHAKMDTAYGVSYLTFRIGSFWPGETARIQCYLPEQYKRFDLGEIVLDGSTKGTLSNLVKFECGINN
jgi:hypothetical protein